MTIHALPQCIPRRIYLAFRVYRFSVLSVFSVCFSHASFVVFSVVLWQFLLKKALASSRDYCSSFYEMQPCNSCSMFSLFSARDSKRFSFTSPCHVVFEVVLWSVIAASHCIIYYQFHSGFPLRRLNQNRHFCIHLYEFKYQSICSQVCRVFSY